MISDCKSQSLSIKNVGEGNSSRFLYYGISSGVSAPVRVVWPWPVYLQQRVSTETWKQSSQETKQTQHPVWCWFWCLATNGRVEK